MKIKKRKIRIQHKWGRGVNSTKIGHMVRRHDPRVPNIFTEIRLPKAVLTLASARIIFESLGDNGSLSVEF